MMRATIAVTLLAAAPTAVLAQDASCSPLHLIYARATTEPPQNYATDFAGAASRVWSKGYGAAGYSLYTNVTKLIPGSTGWPVHYPASAGESAPKGVTDMIEQISKMAKACPKQKYALGGHSQGGMVTVAAIPKIPKDLLAKVVAVTMFGSPACPAAVQDRCRSYCNKGDFVCDAAGGKGGKGGAPKGAKAAGGKGGAPKLPKGPVNSATSTPPVAAEKRGVSMIDESIFTQDGCGEEPVITGHVAKSSENAHLAYNKDGLYVKAAACYIAKQYRASGSA